MNAVFNMLSDNHVSTKIRILIIMIFLTTGGSEIPAEDPKKPIKNVFRLNRKDRIVLSIAPDVFILTGSSYLYAVKQTR
jgi:hypothetical protein